MRNAGASLSHATEERTQEGAAAQHARCMQGKQDAAGRALVGLLVHSAADGFAVGASSVSSSASLPFLVAVAMVLHKARRSAHCSAAPQSTPAAQAVLT